MSTIKHLRFLFAPLLFSIFVIVFSFSSQAFAYFELNVTVSGNALLINSCGSQLPGPIGYKGYINDVEMWTTGFFGGYPCYNGDGFISDLKSFVSSHPAPLTLRFDFYSGIDFGSPIHAQFTIYYNGSEFSLTDNTSPPPDPACTVNCFSNVLFLPGLMGSRLYEQDGLNDKELWTSSIDSLQARLGLDANGKSINDLYTKDDTQNNGELDETGIVDDIDALNIYQSFITDLKNWKQEGTIADYAFIPYDWRLSLDDVITNGVTTTNDNLSYITTQNFSESFLLKKLEALQSNSKSGKVTIITHSNGGLVAKALVQKLKDTNNPLYDQIDKVILVAVPQIGTPDAMATLLHGTKLGSGWIMDNDRSRQLSENMPTVYNLLPSTSYFTTVDPGFAIDKLASFEDQPFFGPQISQYGVFVSNETELKNYILGTDGRSKPAFSDTLNPNIGNNGLYDQAQNVHQILDSWQPSPNTKVIQVAGWGEETIAGINYKTKKESTETITYKPTDDFC